MIHDITIKATILTPDGKKNRVEIYCDTIADVTPANVGWSGGSIAWTVEESQIYGLTSEGNWVEQIT